MLPFPKRGYRDDVVELEDDDLVEVEPPVEIPVVFVEEERASRPSRPAFSRRVTTPDLEDDVVGECLASISASTTRTRTLTPLTLPSPPASRRSVPPSSGSMMVASRLPAVMPPPFVRTRTSEPSLFVRTPPPPASSSTASMPPASLVPSIAPSTASIRPEPTVILVRERPRAGWMAGAAIVGAAAAIIVTRLLTAPASVPAAPVAALPAPPPPSTQVVVPATPAPAPSPEPQATAAAPAVALTVKFSEDDAVAIPAPSAAPAASHAVVAPKPKPKAAPKPAVGPMLPDGSLSLGPAQPAATTPAAPVAPPPGPLAPVRKFTPEQELAAAQLKAASK